jgi:hypothetical protein
MGVAVIGGLLFSTFLSLLFVPAAAIWVDRLERLILGLLRIRHERARVEETPLPAAAE